MNFIGIFIGLTLSLAHSQSLSQEEIRFSELINQFRQSLGLQKLIIHPALQNASLKHSEWMAKNEFLTHYGPMKNESPFQRMIEEGYLNYSMLGENVACGNSEAKETFLQWVNSPEHLKNMITPAFEHMGIARAGDGNEDCPFYWTNDFGSKSFEKMKDPLPDAARIKLVIDQIIGPSVSD
jgi:uncharacterized protein YkwD